METGMTSTHLEAESRLPFEPKMIHIAAGEFLMGEERPFIENPTSEDIIFENAYAGGWMGSQHTVYLPGYFIAKTPVTQAQYAAFLQDTEHHRPKRWRSNKPPRGKEDFPVVYVSWHDALAYCDWLSSVSGKPYRLPSEAEWEKAARGTYGRVYPWGDVWDQERCNSLEARTNGPTPVNAYVQGISPFGLLDMAGNVWEWTISLWGTDWYKPVFEYPYDADDGREELQAGADVCRVLRGGSFAYAGQFARCAYRYKNFPQNFSDGIGFRVTLNSTWPGAHRKILSGEALDLVGD